MQPFTKTQEPREAFGEAGFMGKRARPPAAVSDEGRDSKRRGHHPLMEDTSRRQPCSESSQASGALWLGHCPSPASDSGLSASSQGDARVSALHGELTVRRVKTMGHSARVRPQYKPDVSKKEAALEKGLCQQLHVHMSIGDTEGVLKAEYITHGKCRDCYQGSFNSVAMVVKLHATGTHSGQSLTWNEDDAKVYAASHPAMRSYMARVYGHAIVHINAGDSDCRVPTYYGSEPRDEWSLLLVEEVQPVSLYFRDVVKRWGDMRDRAIAIAEVLASVLDLCYVNPAAEPVLQLSDIRTANLGWRIERKEVTVIDAIWGQKKPWKHYADNLQNTANELLQWCAGDAHDDALRNAVNCMVTKLATEGRDHQRPTDPDKVRRLLTEAIADWKDVSLEPDPGMWRAVGSSVEGIP